MKHYVCVWFYVFVVEKKNLLEQKTYVCTYGRRDLYVCVRKEKGQNEKRANERSGGMDPCWAHEGFEQVVVVKN